MCLLPFALRRGSERAFVFGNGRSLVSDWWGSAGVCVFAFSVSVTPQSGECDFKTILLGLK